MGTIAWSTTSAESDGSMVRHGLQGLHGSTITVPGREAWRSSRDALAQRLGRFRKAG